MARKKIRPLGHCSRCTRACWKDADDFHRWNATMNRSVLVGLVCPECQTAEEHIEAEVKEATLDYASAVPDASGRPIVAPIVKTDESVHPSGRPSMPVSVPAGRLTRMPVVIVYPPDEQGGRRVRVDGEISGRALGLKDVVEFLRRAGADVEDTDVVRADWIEWRGGGPDMWEH
ncbi:hypothetical protein AB0E62_27300 [Streptomyces sp. NPDC038707]|uniref:hypothetical protein n=1 Tax=Streptomyces sp. NPDC038707 TaxID=3154329 RepID=UPI0033C5013E